MRAKGIWNFDAPKNFAWATTSELVWAIQIEQLHLFEHATCLLSNRHGLHKTRSARWTTVSVASVDHTTGSSIVFLPLLLDDPYFQMQLTSPRAWENHPHRSFSPPICPRSLLHPLPMHSMDHCCRYNSICLRREQWHVAVSNDM